MHDLRVRRERRGGGQRAARGRCPSTALPAAHVEDTPDTPTIDTLVDLANARPELARGDRPWTAGDTLKNVVVKVAMPDGTSYPLVIGLPGDREVDMKRLEALLLPGEPVGLRGGRLRGATPRW